MFVNQGFVSSAISDFDSVARPRPEPDIFSASPENGGNGSGIEMRHPLLASSISSGRITSYLDKSEWAGFNGGFKSQTFKSILKVSHGSPSKHFIEKANSLQSKRHAGDRFPMPCLFERLGRLLDKVKPDMVFACYGMNCGIYPPLDDVRFGAFQSGVKLGGEGLEFVEVKIPLCGVFRPRLRRWPF